MQSAKKNKGVEWWWSVVGERTNVVDKGKRERGREGETSRNVT